MQRTALIAILTLAACKDRSEPVGPTASGDAGAAEVEAAGASSRVARADGHPDASLPLDAACEGMKLALIGAVLDAHCAVSDYEWLGLAEAPGLKQEAKSEGDRVVFALVNHGAKAIDVPLRFDDRHPERAFSAVAETDGGLFALVAPTFEFVRGDAGVHVHSARIRLPPGGSASVALAVDLAVGERLAGATRDAGTPKRLDPPVTLHIGQLLCPFEMGDPATLVR